MVFFLQMCRTFVEAAMMTCNYKQPCDSLCGLLSEATVSINDSLCYSNSICVDIKLNKPTLQEQWSLDCQLLEEVSTYI